nr:DUF2304 domain-containing protein [uncultured Faecalimonas sp.]
MDIKIQLIVAVIIMIAMGIVVMMIRNKQLELRYALSWFALGVGILILDCFPDLITEMSKIMGIGTPINMLFFFGFCFSLMVIFVLTVVVSKLTVKVKRLAQEIALMKNKGEADGK